MAHSIKLSRMVSVVLILMATIVSSMAVTAQTISSKTVNNKTYLFSKNSICNKSNSKNKSNLYYVTDGFTVNDPMIVSSVFKRVLSSERLAELKRDKVAVVFDCDKDGNVQSVEFLFTKKPFLTASEVEKLEAEFLKTPFSVTWGSKETSNIKFSIPCFFSRIQK